MGLPQLLPMFTVTVGSDSTLIGVSFLVAPRVADTLAARNLNKCTHIGSEYKDLIPENVGAPS